MNGSTRKSKKKFKNSWKQMNVRTQQFKTLAFSKSKKQVYSIQVYLKKQGKYQLNNLILHLKVPGKEQTKSKTIRKKKKFRAEINDTETKKTQQNGSMKGGAGSLNKTNKTDESFARFINIERERTQGTWLVQSVEHAALDLRGLNLSSTLVVEIT